MLFFIFKVRVAISAQWSLSASRTLQEVVIYRGKKKKPELCSGRTQRVGQAQRVGQQRGEHTMLAEGSPGTRGVGHPGQQPSKALRPVPLTGPHGRAASSAAGWALGCAAGHEERWEQPQMLSKWRRGRRWRLLGTRGSRVPCLGAAMLSGPQDELRVCSAPTKLPVAFLPSHPTGSWGSLAP